MLVQHFNRIPLFLIRNSGESPLLRQDKMSATISVIRFSAINKIMLRFIALCIVLFTASITFGQTETGYIPPMPCSLSVDCYHYNIQELYENLPKFSNADNVSDTSALENTALALDSTALFIFVIIAAIVSVVIVIVVVILVVIIIAVIAVTIMKRK